MLLLEEAASLAACDPPPFQSINKQTVCKDIVVRNSCQKSSDGPINIVLSEPLRISFFRLRNSTLKL